MASPPYLFSTFLLFGPPSGGMSPPSSLSGDNGPPQGPLLLHAVGKVHLSQQFRIPMVLGDGGSGSRAACPAAFTCRHHWSIALQP